MKDSKHTQLIALLLALVTLTGCGGALPHRNPAEDVSVSTQTPVVETEQPPPEEAEQESAAPSVYDQLYQAVWNEQDTCRIDNLSGDEVGDYLLQLMKEPELFWLESCETTSYTQGGVALYVEVTFQWRYDEIGAKRQAVEAAKEQFWSTVPADSSDYEKAKAAHDYLVTHITYDTGTTGGQDIYAALVEGRCVCSGYANAYAVLLEGLDVTCETVSGTADGGPHAWNWTVLDGETYYTDVTWDDQDTVTTDGKEQISYHWFNLTLAEMAQRHTPDEGEEVPPATATAANYYTVEQAWLTEYTVDEVERVLQPQVGNGSGVLTFRCASEGCYTAALEGLIEHQEIYQVLRDLGNDSREISYTREDDLWIVTVICSV